MHNRHVNDQLSEYIDGMLGPEEASAVKEHLDHCPDCMNEYAEMVKIIGYMSQMESLEMPEFFVEKVHERLKKRSLRRRVFQGLFFPLKIKLPLEIAGLAAAALLVVYITAIRGRPHVYELTVAQKPQPMAVLEESTVVLEEKKIDRDAKINEAAALNKRARPPTELKDKEMEKGEKRVETVEAIPSGKKEQLPTTPQAPQAKQKEAAAIAGETTLHSQEVHKRAKHGEVLLEDKFERKAEAGAEALSSREPRKNEEPGHEIDAAEIAEIKKEAPDKMAYQEQSLQNIIIALGGKVLESETKGDARISESLIIEIPAEKYPELLQILEERGTIQKPFPALKEKDRTRVQIRINLLH